MKVLMYPSDQTAGCSYYRMYQPAEAAKRAGVEVETSFHFPIKREILANGTDRVTGVQELDADVVVFHRPLDYRIAAAIPFLRKAGIGVVVDMDDDLRSIDDASHYAAMHSPDRPGRLGNARDNWQHCLRSCKLADVVTCSTPVIKRRWGCGHGVVVRNGIPPHILEMPFVGGGGIGWSGSSAGHVGDLEVVGDGIQRALEDTGLPFMVAGDGIYVQQRLGLHKRPRVTGWTPAGEHFANVAQFDIGIAPLSSTAFSQARSAIKVLEYAALGIPSVASPLPEYELAAAAGLCVLARSPEEWRKHLGNLTRCGWYGAVLRDMIRGGYTTDHFITSALDSWQLAAAKAARRSRIRPPRSSPSPGRRRASRS